MGKLCSDKPAILLKIYSFTTIFSKILFTHFKQIYRWTIINWNSFWSEPLSKVVCKHSYQFWLGSDRHWFYTPNLRSAMTCGTTSRASRHGSLWHGWNTVLYTWPQPNLLKKCCTQLGTPYKIVLKF